MIFRQKERQLFRLLDSKTWVNLYCYPCPLRFIPRARIPNTIHKCIKSTIKQPLPPRENPLFITAEHALYRHPTDQESHDLAVLSWLVEIFNASLLLEDNVKSSSQTEATVKTNQELSWYDRPGVGLTAINDTYLLKTSVMILLRKEMRSHPAYLAFMDLFGEARYHVELETLRDDTGGEAPRKGLKSTDGAFESKCKVKGAGTKTGSSYRAYLPVALALEYSSYARDGKLVGQ